MNQIFDEWARNDMEQIRISDFEQALMSWYGVGATVCVYKPICGRALALEHNGDLYACDHFVTPRFKLGNIHQVPIIQLVNQHKQKQFGHSKTLSLPQTCLKCEVRFACNGGCPKDRLLSDPNTGEPGFNYLCEGYKKFYTYVNPVMQAMSKAIRSGNPPISVIHELRTKNSDA